MSLKSNILFRLITARNQIVTFFTKTLPSHLVEVPYVSANPGDCGIGCISMLLNHQISVDKLARQYKKPPFYTESLGWSHEGLKKILKDNQLECQLKRYHTPQLLIQHILKNQPVFVSLKVPNINNLGNELYTKADDRKDVVNHLCLLVGVDRDSLILHDPRNVGIYSANVSVPIRLFSKIFTGNCIVVENYKLFN